MRATSRSELVMREGSCWRQSAGRRPPKFHQVFPKFRHAPRAILSGASSIRTAPESARLQPALPLVAPGALPPQSPASLFQAEGASSTNLRGNAKSLHSFWSQFLRVAELRRAPPAISLRSGRIPSALRSNVRSKAAPAIARADSPARLPLFSWRAPRRELAARGRGCSVAAKSNRASRGLRREETLGPRVLRFRPRATASLPA